MKRMRVSDVATSRGGFDSSVDPIVAFNGPTGTGLDSWFHEPAYTDRNEARRAWSEFRRVVWEATSRFRIPKAAQVYDGLSYSSRDHVRTYWQHVGPFDLKGALEALAEDRETLARFETSDQDAAASIADFLNLLRADFDVVEATARALAAHTRPHWTRSYPGHLNVSITYSQGSAR